MGTGFTERGHDRPHGWPQAGFELVNGLMIMQKNPILDLPLSQVMRGEIAIQLQQMLHVHTVGHLLDSWRRPGIQRKIEQIFDTPEQARHAVAVCSTWLGFQSGPAPMGMREWWPDDERPIAEA